MTNGILRTDNHTPLNTFDAETVINASDKSLSEMKGTLSIDGLSRVCRATTSPFFSAAKLTLGPYCTGITEALNKARNLDNARSVPERIWGGISFFARAIGSAVVMPLGIVFAAVAGGLSVIPSFYKEFSSSVTDYKLKPSLFPQTANLSMLDQWYSELGDKGPHPLTALGQSILLRLDDAIGSNDHETATKLLFSIEQRLTPPLVRSEFQQINTSAGLKQQLDQFEDQRSEESLARGVMTSYKRGDDKLKAQIRNDDDKFAYIEPRLTRLATINAKYNAENIEAPLPSTIFDEVADLTPNEGEKAPKKISFNMIKTFPPEWDTEETEPNS